MYGGTMKQYLIKTSTNWADEIDLHGWLILDENDLAAAKKKLQNLSDKLSDVKRSLKN